MKYLFVFCLLLIMATQAQAQLIINEVLYDPSNTGLDGDANGDGVYDQTQDEFIEFVNTGPTDLAIFKYRIFEKVKATGVKTRRHTIIRATVPSNGAIVVFGGGTPVGTFGGAIVRADTGSAGLSLSNSGEIIILEDSLGNVLDSLDTDALSNNPDESYTRNPDITGDFVQHGSVTPGKLFSPGTKVNGDPFNTVLSVTKGIHNKNSKVFPNPSAGKLHISIPEEEIELLTVFDLKGKEWANLVFTDGILDLSPLPNGMYQVKITTKTGQVLNKVVISR